MQSSFGTTIVSDAILVEQRLINLGLDLPGLTEVVLRGEQARALCVPNDPLISPGFDAWRYRVRALRDIYIPRGWDKANIGGLELLHSVDRRMRVITRAGDQGVGIVDAFPQPKREIVGPTTAAVIDENATLFLDPNWMNVCANDTDCSYRTWMLLVYSESLLARAELSLPSAVKDGRVQGWEERIILGDLNLAEPLVDSGATDLPVVVDVPVIRK